jgi:hypothetical protein
LAQQLPLRLRVPCHAAQPVSARATCDARPASMMISEPHDRNNSPMPPRPPRLLSLAPPKIRAIDPSGCISCSLRRLSVIPRQPALLDSRPSSTFVSSSAVGSSEAQQLEPAARELFESLDVLKATAANYINLSRLQLALQGVAGGPRARVRVAGM